LKQKRARRHPGEDNGARENLVSVSSRGEGRRGGSILDAIQQRSSNSKKDDLTHCVVIRTCDHVAVCRPGVKSPRVEFEKSLLNQ
jgi:hypothetical protein